MLINEFHDQFERYNSFTVEEAIYLCCGRTSFFSMSVVSVPLLSPNAEAVKHMIAAEYKSGNIELDRFWDSSISGDYYKSRISKSDLLKVAAKLNKRPDFTRSEND